MKPIRLILTALAFLAFGCTKQASEHGGHDHGHDHAAQQTSGMHLNHGGKWKVNEEMKPFIRASEELLTAGNETDEADFLSLADQLIENNNQVLSNCTMEGESHEMLHLWLSDHMELSEKLRKADNAEGGREIMEKLRHSFNTYHTYFE